MAKGQLKVYDDFLGIDESEGVGMTLDGRSPEIVNMYKDYGKTKGRILETIVGFRKRFCVDGKAPTDFFFYKAVENGDDKSIPIVHVEDKLYLWSNYPNDLGIEKSRELSVDENGVAKFPFDVDKVLSVNIDGESVNYIFDKTDRCVTVSKEYKGKALLISFVQKEVSEEDLLISGIGKEKLLSFVYGGLMYLMDGERYLVFDGEKVYKVEPYIPTTYIGITSSSIGEKLDEKNILTELFYNTFAADGETSEFYLSENEIKKVLSVSVYGEIRTDYTVDLDLGKITFDSPIKSGSEVGFEEGYSGIKVLAKGKENPLKKSLLSSKTAKAFEGCVVLSGAEDFGGIYYSAIDSPEYFPEINYAYIGGGVGKITGLSICANELFAYFSASDGGGIYRITSIETGLDNSPIVFFSELVSSSEKTIYGGIDFLDLPTFLTSNGVFALASPNLKLERVVEKRSGLINSALLSTDIKNAKLFSFDGYFCVYVDGKVFMGDSRRVYRNERGESEFEWFKLSDIGSYKNGYKRYVFSDKIDGYDEKYFLLSEVGNTANPPNDEGKSENAIRKVNFNSGIENVVTIKSKIPVFSNDEITYEERADEYIVKECEENIGGVFEVALDIKSYDGNIFFSTESGLYSFNFDKKEEDMIYDFDGRTIKCCVSTKLDDLGYPDMRKSTLPKSLVIKLKTAKRSKIKVLGRIDGGAYKKIGEIDGSVFDFSDTDFSAMSFNTKDQKVYVLPDKTKNFLEKQIAIMSDEYQSPIKLKSISYRYKTVGKIRNKRR